ncbi:MAG: hypothetical protein ABW154_14285 [Dyella sp.]
MDIAVCNLDGEIYYAAQFAQLPMRELERLRKDLSCKGCRGPAYFRRASTSGRSACFGARPHADGCEFGSADSGTWGTDGSDVADELANTGDHIMVDLRFGADDERVAAAGGAEQRQGHGKTFGTGTGIRHAKSHKRLTGLLRLLMHSEDFRNSTAIVELPGQLTLSAKEFFVPFGNIDSSMHLDFRGYWGLVRSAESAGSDGIWLNTGSRGDFSVRLPGQVYKDLKARFEIEDLDRLAGAYVLVIAKLAKSKKDKLLCWPNDAAYVALNLAPD